VTPTARIVAVVAGIVSLLLCAAALVRQAALATNAGLTWKGSAWWTDLTAGSSTGTIVAAVVVALVTVALVVFAYRQVQPAVPPQVIEFAVDDGTARLSVPALRKALRRRFETMLPGSQVGEVAVSADDGGWHVRVEADVPICDLRDVQSSVLFAFRDDMRKVADIEISSLDLVVTSMRSVAKKAKA
jgi:hypothetical protein